MTRLGRFLATLLLAAGLAGHAAAFEVPGLAADSEAYARSLAARAPSSAEARTEADRRAEAAIRAGNWAEAVTTLEARIRLGEAEERHWLALAEAWQKRTPPDGNRALQAAWQAFAMVPGGVPEIPSILRIAEVFETVLDRPAQAIEALEAVVERDPANATYRQRLAALRRSAGLAVRRVLTEPESDPPRACIEFAGALSPRRDIAWADWVRVEPGARTSVTAEGNRLCVAGLGHGRRWDVTLREGLPGADQATLLRATTLAVAMPDRAPRVVLQSGAFVLPKGDAPRLTVGTVNLSAVAVKLYRVGERGLAGQIGDQGRAFRPLSQWSARNLAEGAGRLVWEGTLTVAPWERNVVARTLLDLAPMLSGAAPGLFALTAAPGDGTPFPSWSDVATQWFVLTDIGLTVLRGADGLTVLARALSDARPLAGLRVAVVARDNDELAVVETDADGVARIAAPVLRGEGGAAPRHVTARGSDGDLAFLDLDSASFDLSDRGVEGRAHPGPLDAWLWTERGIYRPGETVNLLALLRNASGDAANVPLTLRLRRPNGTVASETVPPPDAAGGRSWQIALSSGAPQGAWTVEALADPKAAPIGRTSFEVADFVPERLAVEIGTAPGPLVPGTPLALPVTARFLYGSPAAGLPARGEITIAPDPLPFPQLAGWRFGLIEDTPDTIREDLTLPDTDAQGRSTATLLLPRAPDTTRPLRATVSIEVSEPGGRPSRARATVPVRAQPRLIGIRPLFEHGAVEAGSEAAFEVAAFDAEGNRIAAPRLAMRLVRERPDWRVVVRERLARYELVWRDEPVEARDLAVSAGEPLRVSRALDWGRYRIEVADGESLAATSVRFRVGFVPTAGTGDTPDMLDVAADKPAYGQRETARVRIEAPYAGLATVMVLTDRVHAVQTLRVAQGPAMVEIPTDPAWGPGAYAAVTLLRGRAEAGANPVRALGLAWLGLDPAPRTVPVAVTAPDLMRPRAPAEVTVRAAPGAQVLLAAVDEGILRLTGHASPDPAGWFTGKRRLGIDIRDDYGRLIAPAEGAAGLLRQGGDGGDAGTALPAIPFVIASMVQGPVVTGPDGTARFTLDVPDVNTALRLMAVAWDAARTGAASVSVPVRDRLVAEPALPRFLAPGDEARMAVSLHNVELPSGEVRVTVTADGPLAVDGGAQALTLARDARGRALFGLRGTGVGVGAVTLRAEGPDGFAATRVFPLTVRPARPPTTLMSRRELPPGQTLTVGRDALAPFIPGTGRVTVTVNTGAPVDLAALARTLDLWPYACLEQTVSKGFPLVFLDDESLIGTDRRARLQTLVGQVLDKQRFDGAFGLWSANDEAEPWLSAYAVEFLLRARAAGAAVPDTPFDEALRFLANSTDEPASEPWARAAQAYALHVLAMAGRPRPGAARVLADQGTERLPTGLARAQLSAALLRMGERGRGEALLRDATADPARDWWWQDYGTTLRDAAAMIVLVKETGMLAERIPGLIDRLPADQTQPARTSTQEQAWLVAAGAVLGRDGQPVALAVDGRERAPAVLTTLVRDAGSLPVSLRNMGRAAVWPSVATTGITAQAPSAARDGLTVRRNFLNRDGSPLNLDTIRQNDVFILAIEGRSETRVMHQALLVHGLPAGWEAEPARLGPGEVAAFPFLGELSRPRALARRDDRLVAQVDLSPEEPAFKLAFLIRAVTPGQFELPGAVLTDMYKPRFFARQNTGRITVAPAD
jgi:uncharacterized protein YfaS (alpha-2-macroglobulin family)